jgi:NAD-dependent dihydropyrimidine dehydrogenase PreA subunit
MGVFIQIDLRQGDIPFQAAEQIVSLCPVEIFEISDRRLRLQPEREDECTLCELCLNAAPAGSLTIRKNYKDEVLVSRGGDASFPLPHHDATG